MVSIGVYWCPIQTEWKAVTVLGMDKPLKVNDLIFFKISKLMIRLLKWISECKLHKWKWEH